MTRLCNATVQLELRRPTHSASAAGFGARRPDVKSRVAEAQEETTGIHNLRATPVRTAGLSSACSSASALHLLVEPHRCSAGCTDPQAHLPDRAAQLLLKAAQTAPARARTARTFLRQLQYIFAHVARCSAASRTVTVRHAVALKIERRGMCFSAA